LGSGKAVVVIVSIITVVHNNVDDITGAIESVLSQDYSSIEYIVIDGASSDGTLDEIEKHRDNIQIFLSEPDGGIYDALNKGIALATGDVVAILHSDDIFSDEHVVTNMVKKMLHSGAEFCFSDMVIVDKESEKVLRYYMANYFRRWMFRVGLMPPHPTCFVKKALFDEFGGYSKRYLIAGDFDFMVRIFYGRTINWTYLDRITVKMRSGGISNSGFKNKLVSAKEINCVLHENNIFSMYIFQIVRYFVRIIELLVKPKKQGYD
jgi:glycosyltransferase involved in cell wall biosynthesis